MIRNGHAPKICTTCDPPHAENCGNCYGWGEHEPLKDGCRIIEGCDVEEAAANGKWKRCPECGGSPVGRIAT